MPRPERCRRICCHPDSTFFKPRGIPLSELDIVELRLDEYEAVRLADCEGLTQSAAAKSMNISQPTFNRIIGKARTKVADAIVNGKALRIDTKRINEIRSEKK
jgi:predicted DNA-binding protein (UPF0251 family)